MLQRSRKVVCRPDIQEVVGGAMCRYDARTCRISQRLRPGCYVRMVAIWVDFQLLAEVRVQRCKALLAEECQSGVEILKELRTS
jgi:hypothetical protein